MRDERKTKAQLIDELAELRQQVAEVQRSVPAGEAAETERVRVESQSTLHRAQREAALEALRLSELRFRSLIEQTTDAVFCYECDPPIPTDLPIEEQVKLLYDCVLVECNDVCARSYGAARAEEVLGKKLTELFGTSSGSLDELFTALIQGAYRIVDGEGVEVLEDGTKRFYLNNGHGVVENGMLLRVWGTFRDITERVRVEAQREATLEALRESEHFLDTIVENIPNMIFVKGGEDLRFVRFNKAGEELLGYTREELIGKNDFDFFPREEAEFFVSKDRAVLESGELLDIPDETIQTRYKGERILHTKKIPIAGAGGRPLLLGISEDITERVQTEEALRESEKQFRNIVESIPMGMHMYQLEPDGRLVFIGANPAADEILGVDNDQFVGKTIEEAFPALTETEVPEKYRLAASEGTIWRTDQIIYEENQISGAFEVHAFQTSPGRMVATFLDITERVRAESRRDAALSQREAALEALRESNLRLEETLAELEATQEQIVQQERLAAVGQLAAGVAHDFNNLLTSIIGLAELTRMSPDIPPTAQADLASIVEQGRRAAHLVRQILDFSRKTIRQPQPLDLVPFLKEAVKFLERTIPESIHIRLEIEPLECLVQADPTQLQQMVTNLAVNARDAMPAGGELKLRLASLGLEPGEGSSGPELPPGEWIALFVSDTGTGIPAEVLPHIFEPFFTTRAPEGSGLGLAQVYGIVKQHEGAIDVESEVGKGTTFAIYLPALAAGAKAVREEAARDIPRGRGETVLLVEDEPVVLEIGQALLERLGYRVLTAADGQQALEVYAEYQAEIALVLADIVMPKMDGLTLFHVLRAQSPDVKMVLTSGYPLGEEAQRVLDQGIVDWLQKPMTLTQLAQVVSRALGR